VVRVVDEAALVEGELAPGTLVVAVGTHRLQEGVAVRVVP
jgi:hypothetical protein